MGLKNIVVGLVALAVLASCGTALIVKGFLADRLCVERVNAFDGANMITNPQAHTVHCLRDIKACVDSGFTVLIHTPGQTAYGPMYNFTANGNNMALNYLNGKDEDTDNVIVTVNGTFLASGLFEITSLSAAPRAPAFASAVAVIAIVVSVFF
jgi:hypothetical protein